MRHALWIAVVVGAMAGCGSDEPKTLASLSDARRAELSIVDHAGLKARLAELEGKMVVLAARAVRQEGGIELHSKLASLSERPVGEKAGPAVVALNLDTVDDVRDEVLPMLRKERPAFSRCVFDGDQMMLLAPSAFFIIGLLIWLLRSWKTEQVEEPDFREVMPEKAGQTL